MWRLLDDIEGYKSEQAARRLVLLRRYLQCTVEYATPLLGEAIDQETLRRALAALDPPRFWPERLPRAPVSGGAWMNGMAADRLAGLHDARRREAFHRRFRSMGAMVRGASHPAGGFGIRVVGRALEVACSTPGGALITTFKGLVRIDVPGPFPETLACCLPGRDVGDVLDHPLLDGRGFPILTAAAGPDALMVVASTGLAPHVMPWPDLARLA